LRTAITAGADTAQLEGLARKAGFRSMFEDGVAKSLAGQTTLEEVLRATRQ
jgi:general secretion pathway protein E